VLVNHYCRRTVGLDDLDKSPGIRVKFGPGRRGEI
jgi:hypothetical protein